MEDGVFIPINISVVPLLLISKKASSFSASHSFFKSLLLPLSLLEMVFICKINISNEGRDVYQCDDDGECAYNCEQCTETLAE